MAYSVNWSPRAISIFLWITTTVLNNTPIALSSLRMLVWAIVLLLDPIAMFLSNQAISLDTVVTIFDFDQAKITPLILTTARTGAHSFAVTKIKTHCKDSVERVLFKYFLANLKISTMEVKNKNTLIP